jgi:hypothetical protein
MLPLCFAAAFLLPATQINPATNRKITAQNYCPPCQLGKLPSSRISTDILALRAQNLQQLSASPDQKPQSQNYVLTVVPKVHKIQQCTETRCSQQNTISSTTSILRPHSPLLPVEWCPHPPLPIPYSSLPTHALTHNHPPSSVLRHELMFYLLGIHGYPSLHTPPFLYHFSLIF